MISPVLLGLLEDAGLSAAPSAAGAVAAHRDLRAGPYGELLGPLRVPDTRLSEVGRAVAQQRLGDENPLAVCAVNTTGAGGLMSLAARWSLVESGVHVVVVETALRDLDDLAGNAARVVAATRELVQRAEVYVDIPNAPGARRALDVVEAAGLGCAIGAAEPVSPLQLAGRLRALIEADVPFKTTGTTVFPDALLLAVHALVEDAPTEDAAELLSSDGAISTVLGWDQRTAERVRRRVRLVGCRSVADTVARLTASGPIS